MPLGDALKTSEEDNGDQEFSDAAGRHEWAGCLAQGDGGAKVGEGPEEVTIGQIQHRNKADHRLRHEHEEPPLES